MPVARPSRLTALALGKGEAKCRLNTHREPSSASLSAPQTFSLQEWNLPLASKNWGVGKGPKGIWSTLPLRLSVPCEGDGSPGWYVIPERAHSCSGGTCPPERHATVLDISADS